MDSIKFFQTLTSTIFREVISIGSCLGGKKNLELKKDSSTQFSCLLNAMHENKVYLSFGWAQFKGKYFECRIIRILPMFRPEPVVEESYELRRDSTSPRNSMDLCVRKSKRIVVDFELSTEIECVN